MNEHEMLKDICDKIGYKVTLININNIGKCIVIKNNIINVREIIFTQEFMNKFIKYYLPEGYGKKEIKELYTNIMLNLNNPVEYLYNLISNE